jgi:hypothetical protein
MFIFKTEADQDRYSYLEKNDPYLTPVHEAGHAVASILLKRRFSYVIIYQRGYKGSDGAVIQNGRCYNNGRPITRDIKRRIIQVYQAGDIAEFFRLADCGVHFSEPGDDGDILWIARPIMNPMRTSDDAVIEDYCKHWDIDPQEESDLCMETCNLIANNWDKVCAVAMALKERHRLGYFEVRRIVLG